MMKHRRKLFAGRQLYEIDGTDWIFVEAIKENLQFHIERCHPYKKLLEKQGFQMSHLTSVEDIHRIPPVPTLHLKEQELFSIPFEKTLFKATSSGTSGRTSRMGMDLGTCVLAFQMIRRTFNYHHLFSAKLTNYIVLGYEPSKFNKTGAVKTAYGTTLAAPAKHREYALKVTDGSYELNLDGIVQALLRYEKEGNPVRFMGFPSYFFFLLEALKEEGIRLKLHPKSKVFLAGGWKQFAFQKMDKQALYQLSEEILGISGDDCRDFYGAVEHPVLYCDCSRHHFHVPVYSRVIIRDPKTLEPVPVGTPGIVNLITPLMASMPLVSVLTDDLAVLHDGRECGCGISSPWFELLGRAGSDVKTCAAGAAELLKEVKL